MIDEAIALAISTEHAPSLAHAYWHQAILEFMRLDARSAKRAAESCLTLARQRDLGLWLLIAPAVHGWAVATLDNAEAAGWDQLRRSLEACREQGQKLGATWFLPQLALAEARAGRHELARRTIECAIDDKVDLHFSDSESHRIRGTIFRIRDPASPELAEEAYLAAISVARQGSARSFELRAALSLAKLYQSTDRPAEAHAVLAPALDGFSPTPEMPEIDQAQELLTGLAEREEIKADAARRRRLTQLHVARANALWAARGVGAPETTEAFARVRKSASGEKDAPGRLAADYGLWVGSYVRGELVSMRAHAEAFLGDVEARPDSPEASVAHRAAGLTCWFADEYREARYHFERALALFQPRRDDDLAFRFGIDPGVAARAYLAAALWPLGEIDRAISLNDRMLARITDLTHVATLAFGRMHAALFELMRGDHARAAPNALELARLAREHDLSMYGVFGAVLEGCATAQAGAPGGGIAHMHRGVENLRAQNVLVFDGPLKIALAEAETRAGDPDRAVAILDEALATADRTGYRAFEAELHRVRGDTLLKHDPTHPAPAEAAFGCAIEIAVAPGDAELRPARAAFPC